MEESHQPHLAVSLRAVHTVITRALEITRTEALSLQREDPIDPTRVRGFGDYVGVLATVVDAHHRTEDDLAFPYFRELLPDMPINKLMADHKRMETLIERFADASRRMVPSAQREVISAAATDIAQTAGDLLEIWGLHIAIEEQYWSRQTIDSVISAEENARLNRLYLEYDQKLAQPASVVVPFMLFNLPPDERGVFTDEMPEEVTGHLVPEVWKPEWEAMTPFLLV